MGKTVSLLQSCSPLSQLTWGSQASVRVEETPGSSAEQTRRDEAGQHLLTALAVLFPTRVSLPFFFFLQLELSAWLLWQNQQCFLSLPWCVSVLMRTVRGRGTWQHQSQTPMLSSCLSQGTRQKPRRPVQVQTSCSHSEAQSWTSKDASEKADGPNPLSLLTIIALAMPNVRYDCPAWDDKWNSIITVIF